MNWDSLYIPVPSAVHQRLEKALEEKEKMNAKKVMKPLTAAALALALILLLGGAAYAAVESGILKYLVNGEQNATDELKNSVQPLDVSVTRDDFRVTLQRGAHQCGFSAFGNGVGLCASFQQAAHMFGITV